MKNELISVIMSVYNEHSKWLQESIESILNQTYKNLEFIIVLDNPKNIELRNIIESYKSKDDRVVFLVNNENRGLVYSLNRGLEIARGEYIARMDADDISHLERLEKQLEYLNKNNSDLIGSNVNLFNENGIFFTTNKLLTHKYLTKILVKGTIGIIHPTFFGRKMVFDNLNGYSELALHTEDKDFVARAICNGFKVGNIKEVLLDCRYNEQSVTKNNAIYIAAIGTYISKLFKECIYQGKKYKIDNKFIENLDFTENDIIKFNNKQKLLGKAREALKNRQYILFIERLLKAILHSHSSTINSIRINLWLKWYRVLENISRFKV